MYILRYQENDLNTANLYLNQGLISKISSLNPSVISITGAFEPERQRVVDFIKNIYKQSYNAEINVTYPMIMSVRNADDEILAAVGVRYADKEALFLEQYLDQPIENVLDCERAQIIEIGNLASAGKGASAFLFAALASYLENQKIRYATITGTQFLHRYFKRTGLNPKELCRAHLNNISEQDTDWGTYYDTEPRVLVGNVNTGVARLKALFGADFRECRPRLFPRLHFKAEH